MMPLLHTCPSKLLLTAFHLTQKIRPIPEVARRIVSIWFGSLFRILLADTSPMVSDMVDGYAEAAGDRGRV